MDVGIFLTEVVDPQNDSVALLARRSKEKAEKDAKLRAFEEKTARADLTRVNSGEPVRFSRVGRFVCTWASSTAC